MGLGRRVRDGRGGEVNFLVDVCLMFGFFLGFDLRSFWFCFCFWF